MVTEATTSRLRWHAGLQEAAEHVPSIASSTWPRGRLQDGLQEALIDCLRTLGSLNGELNNQARPGEVARAADVPRSVAYAVAEIVRVIRDSQHDAQDQHNAAVLGRAAWRIETAWSAILAGDVDDIERHVEEEEAARFE